MVFEEWIQGRVVTFVAKPLDYAFLIISFWLVHDFKFQQHKAEEGFPSSALPYTTNDARTI